MKTHRNHLMLAAAITLSLSGCAMTDGARTKLEGTGLGAVAGGALGYLIGGRDGAAVGAILGGGVGYVVGNNVAQRKQQYASLEDGLDGEIAYYSELNRSVASTNQQISQEIAQLDKQTRRLRQQYRSGTINKKQMLSQKAAIHKQLQKNKKYVADLSEKYRQDRSYLNNELSQSGDSAKIAKLKKQHQRFKKQLDKAVRNQKQYAKMEQRMSV